MTPRGIWLVTQQEFRIRLRTGRWRWLLGGWVALLTGFTVLLDLSLQTGFGIEPDNSQRGVPLFGFIMLFVLGMVLVISPALTAQTINGDRERGTLATLQVTRLSSVEITLGKLLAGWGVGLVALALTLPFVAFALANGGVTPLRAAAVYGVVALLIGVICAVSQALSAVLARSITSALLSYLVVFGLTVGTLIAFTLIAPQVTETRTQTTPEGYTYTSEIVRYDKVWWLLAPNPFVVLADSAPRVPPRVDIQGDVYYVQDYDPLSAIGRTVREVRRAPTDEPMPDSDIGRGAPVWPTGLGLNLLFGVAAVVVTSLRLRAPSRRVPKGVRIA
jgi:ABC-type transport system involved in multi-copper enzyme maturation permease subunit